MKSDTLNDRLQIFHGIRQLASYSEQAVGIYTGNPLIEALPPIWTAQEVMKRLAYYPPYDPKERKLPAETRLHLIQNALRFFAPLPMHLDLEQRISRMLRSGYVGRNPVAPNFWVDLSKRTTRLSLSSGLPLKGTGVNGFSMIGIPGIGKTTGTERILGQYPQIISHTAYQNSPFSRIQLVWLKLACPFDGSIKGLCLNFFQAVDDLIGTDYYHGYASGGRRTIDELIPSMARVAWIHSLGLLVIDEIQHLSEARSGGAQKMLNFFVQLINTLGLPMLLIGTYQALPILSREFRQIRRSSGQGDLVWDRMRNDETWHLFVESLWRYQYVHSVSSLNKDLSDALYDESQGVTDFAAKLFMLAQARAITICGEKLTTGIIRSVAQDSLRLAQPVLKALRNGDTTALVNMGDIHPIDFDTNLREMARTNLIPHLRSNEAHTETSDGAHDDTSAVLPTTQQTPSTAKQLQEKKFKTLPKVECALVKTVNHGAENGLSPHDALQQRGFIGSNSCNGKESL